MAEYRDIAYRQAEAAFEQRPDGCWIVTCPTALGPYPTRYTEYLEHWAAATPERVFLAQRTQEGPWRRVTYAEMWRMVQCCAQALLDRGLDTERPVAVLSGNDIEQVILGLAAMHVGIPFAPISPSYALLATDFVKLRLVLGLTTPGLVYANDGARFGAAAAAVLHEDVELVVAENPPVGRPATPFAALLDTEPTAAVAAAAARVTPDTVAKLLFTSGSTGTPKGVINTHRTLCSNARMVQDTWHFVRDMPPVMVDWLPWNHTAGGNHNFSTVYANGGTCYIDDGRPTPAGLAETLRNLREVSPTIYISMPRGFEDLVPHLKADRGLRETFFRDLHLIFYAGAALPAHVWAEYDALAEQTLGRRVLMMTGLGSTETGPFALASNKQYRGAGVIGLPAPGVTLKLVPTAGKLELRIKSPSITVGYWRQPDLTQAAYDEEGFYCMKDAVRFADPANPLAGFLFDGRINEDFKLTTGTWVSVGALRTQLIAQFAPLIRDVVIAGQNRDYIALLLLPDRNALQGLDPEAVREAFQEKLDTHAAHATGSSMRALRCLVLDGDLSMDQGELTDKGSINQQAVLENRQGLVEALYAEPPGLRVICAAISEKVK